MLASVINFDKPTAEAFREAYKKAVAENKGTFMFQDKEVLTCYAKYLCEYMVMQGLLPKEQ